MEGPPGGRQGGRPQSNQRGIETEIHLFGEDRALQGLNRTSVGLKPRYRGQGADVSAAPQSNQRGIETGGSALVASPDWGASIEPAWD